MQKVKTDWTLVDRVLGNDRDIDIDKLVADSLANIQKQTEVACAKLQKQIDIIKSRQART